MYARSTERRANKVHVCDYCHAPIAKGTRYWECVAVDECWGRVKLHPPCSDAIRQQDIGYDESWYCVHQLGWEDALHDFANANVLVAAMAYLVIPPEHQALADRLRQEEVGRHARVAT